MDWRAIEFDWNKARAFLVTAEEGSLSAAARALKLSQPTLGRQVDALEKELGVTLFERVPRGLALTESGTALLQHVRTMGEAANRLSLAASGRYDDVSGTVTVTATEAMAAFGVPRLVRKLRDQQPGLDVEILASNSTSDLKRREADIAIRSYRPTQSDLIAKKIGDIPHFLYASPDYLQRLGNPTTPAGFSNANFIGFDQNEQLIEAYSRVGIQLTLDRFPVRTENHLVHWELVKAGVGIGVMPAPIGDSETGVSRCLQNQAPLMGELWLAAHRELKTSRRIRTVFDFLAEELAKGINPHA
ncbi:MAG: LysR family transcriptional regulator [Pseudomonadota bacterium]